MITPGQKKVVEAIRGCDMIKITSGTNNELLTLSVCEISKGFVELKKDIAIAVQSYYNKQNQYGSK